MDFFVKKIGVYTGQLDTVEYGILFFELLTILFSKYSKFEGFPEAILADFSYRTIKII